MRDHFVTYSRLLVMDERFVRFWVFGWESKVFFFFFLVFMCIFSDCSFLLLVFDNKRDVSLVIFLILAIYLT